MFFDLKVQSDPGRCNPICPFQLNLSQPIGILVVKGFDLYNYIVSLFFVLNVLFDFINQTFGRNYQGRQFFFICFIKAIIVGIIAHYN